MPKAIVAQFPGVDYFEVASEAGRIILKPLQRSRADEVRRKIEHPGIREQDVADAIDWARKR